MVVGPRGLALRFVHPKHSQKAGPFSVARLKTDLPFHNRLAYNREVPALLSPLLFAAGNGVTDLFHQPSTKPDNPINGPHIPGHQVSERVLAEFGLPFFVFSLPCQRYTLSFRVFSLPSSAFKRCTALNSTPSRTLPPRPTR